MSSHETSEENQTAITRNELGAYLVNVSEIEPHLHGHVEVDVTHPDVCLADDLLARVLVHGEDLQLQQLTLQVLGLHGEQEAFFVDRVGAVLDGLRSQMFWDVDFCLRERGERQRENEREK